MPNIKFSLHKISKEALPWDWETYFLPDIALADHGVHNYAGAVDNSALQSLGHVCVLDSP